MKSDKRKAESKMNIVMVKLQDIYHLNINERIATKLNEVLDCARELESRIEDESNWKK